MAVSLPGLQVAHIHRGDDLFRSESGRQVLRQFLRTPVADHAGTPSFVSDGQRALDVMLEARIGTETANSFLIVASAQTGRANQLVHSAEAWLSSGERLQQFRSQRAISKGASGYLLTSTSGPTEGSATQSSWLRNEGHKQQPIHLGQCFEDLVLEAVWADDMEALSGALITFDEFLAANRCESSHDSKHPFVRSQSQAMLPGDFLDCTFKNLILDGHDSLHFIDRELGSSWGRRRGAHSHSRLSGACASHCNHRHAQSLESTDDSR